jgi:hypothetical protein
MDSLERLSHSLEQAVSLVLSLRRENREFAAFAAQESKANAALRQDLTELKRQIDEKNLELAEARAMPGPDLEAIERARQAELEAAALAQSLEGEKRLRHDEGRFYEGKVHDLELRLMAAEREEIMPLPPLDRSVELEALQRRCAELEVMLAQAQESLEKSRGDITALQVRIAESASAEEVSKWQAQVQNMQNRLESLQKWESLHEGLELEKVEIKRQKKALGAIFKEREITKKKLDEIYAALDDLRLG